MLDAKNNAALRAYMNFKDYRQTIEAMDNNKSAPATKEKKGLMTYSKNLMPKQNRIVGNAQDKELRKVLEYVQLIEGMKGGN
tara:strand:- start:11219 stop:11464 length:246 start_codon:yes stop_codon:yes gene_type:complete